MNMEVKSEEKIKDYEGKKPDSLLTDYIDVYDTLLDDHRRSYGASEISLKDYGGRKEPILTLKDSGSENKYDVHLKDNGNIHSAEVTPEILRARNVSDLSLNDDIYGDIMLENHEIRNKPILFSKEPDISSRYHESDDRSHVLSIDHVDGHKHVALSKDNKTGCELDVLSQCEKELDISSTNYLQRRSESDGLIFIDLIDKEESNGSTRNGKSRENHALLEDRKGVEEHNVLFQNFDVRKEPDRGLKEAEGRDKHKAFSPSKLRKVSKKKRNRNGPIKSAFLYQAYLNMISSANKKMKSDLITERMIQPPNSAKSSTSELAKTATTNATTTQPLQTQKKVKEGNRFSREFLRKQFRQKKASLRRDLLADSSEAFLSFLDSAECSEELQECNDGLEKFNRFESSSSNEITESHDLTPCSNDSSDVRLSRCAENMLPFDNILIPKRSKMSPLASGNIQCRLGFQVVFMKDSQGSPLRTLDLDEVQHLLDAEVMRFILENERSHFVPQFFGFSVDHNYNWFILNCKDRETLNWVLNWNPMNSSQAFTIVEYEKAPWRSIMICFTIRKDKPEVEEFVRLLASQNRTLNVVDWRNVRITGHQGEWTLFFLLTADESKQLDEVGWVIFFEHSKLQVVKL